MHIDLKVAAVGAVALVTGAIITATIPSYLGESESSVVVNVPELNLTDEQLSILAVRINRASSPAEDDDVSRNAAVKREVLEFVNTLCKTNYTNFFDLNVDDAGTVSVIAPIPHGFSTATDAEYQNYFDAFACFHRMSAELVPRLVVR